MYNVHDHFFTDFCKKSKKLGNPAYVPDEANEHHSVIDSNILREFI